MYLKSMTVTDYSTGTSYSYGDKSGTWESITSEGGEINGNKGAEPTSTESAPAITSTADNAPVPWSGTHKETSSWVTPNVWPWVASDSPTASSTGYQYDWESSSGHNKPPGGASASKYPYFCVSLFSRSSANAMLLYSLPSALHQQHGLLLWLSFPAVALRRTGKLDSAGNQHRRFNES